MKSIIVLIVICSTTLSSCNSQSCDKDVISKLKTEKVRSLRDDTLIKMGIEPISPGYNSIDYFYVYNFAPCDSVYHLLYETALTNRDTLPEEYVVYFYNYNEALPKEYFGVDSSLDQPQYSKFRVFTVTILNKNNTIIFSYQNNRYTYYNNFDLDYMDRSEIFWRIHSRYKYR